MWENEEKTFWVDQALAEKLLRRDREAEEQVAPHLAKMIEKFLHKTLTTGFQKDHLDEIRQRIMTRFTRQPAKIWEGLAKGNFTYPQFCAMVELICLREGLKLFNQAYYKRLHPSDVDAGDEEYGGDHMDRLPGRAVETPLFEVKEHAEAVGRKVVVLYRSCPSMKRRGGNALALLLLAARYFILKRSLVIMRDVPQPKAGIQLAERTVEWTDEDGGLRPFANANIDLRRIWGELVNAAGSSAEAFNQDVLAKILNISRNDLDQRLRRMRGKIREYIVSLDPPSDVAREAMALISDYRVGSREDEA